LFPRNDFVTSSIQKPVMQIFSNPDRDVSTPKPDPGSYEWWYFDAISDDRQYSLVVIFYEGNPFSRRYIDAIENKSNDKAGEYPATSISIYKNGEPIFYSFEEVYPQNAMFSTNETRGNVKKNSFKKISTDDGGHTYLLKLNQTLPNGDTLTGELTFSSTGEGPFPSGYTEESDTPSSRHQWNLIQPAAVVSGNFRIDGLQTEAVAFEGTGYHDHNTGMEPMKDSFYDWYWGRFHLPGYTLVYYMMNQGGSRHDCAWIIDSNNKVNQLEGNFVLSDMALNLFGLKSARKIELDTGKNSFLIQQESALDDGPFYQRFSSRLMLKFDGELYQANGISEYINPARIHMKIFRPLVNMRIQYPDKAHWVQKSQRLYRWTW